ncbi:MAG: hypothetical protein HRU49_08065 [Winogradskyella sp.]|uniref:hypothetical protein n=1 Tax=Winogradskyella sp. TaxID=1883156 RepID=UPI0025D41B4B|nr:hypothetical protein [Winogradskyella sp.]NRB83714.1 hypothetical protein [Winogradskyella sp.]
MVSFYRITVLSLPVKYLDIVDSTTVPLFSNILKGVKRNPISGEKKDGIKTLRSQLRNARGGDAMSRIHIADAIKRVNNILDPK